MSTSIAAAAAQQQGAAASTTTGQNALQSLSGNFGSFLKLLMTQLQNQDPTSPLDTNQFTSQLVQFSSVEQQINTNTSLSQLISLTQSGQVVQSTAMLGHKVSVASDHLSLQDHNGAIQFALNSAQPVTVDVTDEAGRPVRTEAISAQSGKNTWQWDGRDDKGRPVGDGAYRVALAGANADGSTAAVDFTVIGTATGVVAKDKSVRLEMGDVDVDFSAVRSVID